MQPHGHESELEEDAAETDELLLGVVLDELLLATLLDELELLELLELDELDELLDDELLAAQQKTEYTFFPLSVRCPLSRP
jgi:hypothetical protein